MVVAQPECKAVAMKRLVFAVIAAVVVATLWAVFLGHPSQAHGLPATVNEFKKMPGGATTVDAGEYVISLLKQGGLPGFSKDDHGWLVAPNIKPPQERIEAHPVLRVLCLRKNDDTSEYYYWVVQESQGAAWQLRRAWRATPEGRLLEEYAVQH